MNIYSGSSSFCSNSFDIFLEVKAKEVKPRISKSPVQIFIDGIKDQIVQMPVLNLNGYDMWDLISQQSMMPNKYETSHLSKSFRPAPQKLIVRSLHKNIKLLPGKAIDAPPPRPTKIQFRRKSCEGSLFGLTSNKASMGILEIYMHKKIRLANILIKNLASTKGKAGSNKMKIQVLNYRNQVRKSQRLTRTDSSLKEITIEPQSSPDPKPTVEILEVPIVASSRMITSTKNLRLKTSFQISSQRFSINKDSMSSPQAESLAYFNNIYTGERNRQDALKASSVMAHLFSLKESTETRKDYSARRIQDRFRTMVKNTVSCYSNLTFQPEAKVTPRRPLNVTARTVLPLVKPSTLIPKILQQTTRVKTKSNEFLQSSNLSQEIKRNNITPLRLDKIIQLKVTNRRDKQILDQYTSRKGYLIKFH